MKVPSSSSMFLPFLCSVATTLRLGVIILVTIDASSSSSVASASSVMRSGISLDEGQLAEIELRRQAKQSSKLDCEQVKVLFLDANVEAAQYSTQVEGGVPKAFDSQGGVIPVSDPNDADTIIGDYSYLITFLNDAFGCIANGAYTFKDTDGDDQITFTASCSGLPFFTITGGRGKYSGAEGFVEFMIETDDKSGYLHEINICSFSDSDSDSRTKKKKRGKRAKLGN